MKNQLVYLSIVTCTAAVDEWIVSEKNELPYETDRSLPLYLARDLAPHGSFELSWGLSVNGTFFCVFEILCWEIWRRDEEANHPRCAE